MRIAVTLLAAYSYTIRPVPENTYNQHRVCIMKRGIQRFLKKQMVHIIKKKIQRLRKKRKKVLS